METGEPAPTTKPRKPQTQRRQGNPIPIPGQREEKGMNTDFTPEEYTSFQTGTPGVQGSFWNPNHNK
ncbi:hypothetical protein DSO57_1026838 [Entomophthora muscae]|uniref:Uncharacterized protein n=1 Tax=Entomophthora muscae TaxID=34485 RepID=A0ACC2S435_9FUNG|nr:hypothetical protein DSO57_1026838 [Entomophthora muscae]